MWGEVINRSLEWVGVPGAWFNRSGHREYRQFVALFFSALKLPNRNKYRPVNTEQDGSRWAIFVVEVPHSTDVPRFAEAFFLNFQASC